MSTLQLKRRLPYYIQLARVDRPIGIFLVLWPTLWALWLAADGIPHPGILMIFILGVILMRSAGCVINDYADRHLDGHVKRTKQRPLATGRVSEKEALALFASLVLSAFLLVLMTNTLTILLSVGGVALAAIYPFMKRHTHLPQIVLGAAFGWSVPMAYAAQTGSVSKEVWLIYTATVIWTVVYDTMYAMVDRDDDVKVGIKSTAVLLGEADKPVLAIMQVFVVLVLLLIGQQHGLGLIYQLGVAIAAALFVYQQHLIRDRDRDECFKAFLNNNWVGAAVFAGLFFDYLI